MNGGGRRKPPGNPGRPPPRPHSRPPADLSADRARALALTPVSRETLHRLDRFVATLLAWQRRMNLVASSTEATLWTRHVADSLQLLAQAITTPGNPPPEPRSAQVRASGASARSCNESATWRVHSVASVEDATRFMRRCQVRSVATKQSSRCTVSRETGVSARARARSADRSGDSGDPERGPDLAGRAYAPAGP